MKLIKRIKFAFKYDIEPEFIVFDQTTQQAVRFLKYEDAEKFTHKNIQYRPSVMVKVEQL